MTAPLTLMAVHAHPDDESSSTGGVLARYANEGVRTVVVTCTNGELGDAPGGIKPGDEGHDEAEVARIRLGELKRACETLGVTHLELLFPTLRSPAETHQLQRAQRFESHARRASQVDWPTSWW